MEKMTQARYEMVIGLEVHAELRTKTKIFCDCPTAFGAAPNTQCCPVCAGFPGTLPVLNEKVIRYAVMAGIATNCRIAQSCRMDRKNYFYPDLPKAYQISQYDQPLCEGGYLDIETGKSAKRIGITRIHIEEDAGKLVHDEKKGTLIDYNRSGMPLIEIVSEPDLRSGEEARAYLQKLRAILLYIGVSDAKMNEGSFRCDVNLSVRERGSEELNTRTEMKNLNSFQSVARAIEGEYARQIEAIERGEAIVQQTRRYDQRTGETSALRQKENANDYRYFPEPNLPRIDIDPEMVKTIAAEMPALPDARKKRFMEDYELSPAMAEQLILRREVADLFERAAERTRYRTAAASLIAAHIAPLAEEEKGISGIDPAKLAAIAQMTGEERINAGTARRLMALLIETGEDPESAVARNGWAQISDEETIANLVDEALREKMDVLRSVRRGKESAFNVLMKAVIDKAGGRGNPSTIRRVLRARIEAGEK